MTDAPLPPEHVLSDSEARAALVRASEIDATVGEGGLTVAELHEIASQAGIAPAALSAALVEVARTAEANPQGPTAWLTHSETAFVAGRLRDGDIAWLIRLLDQLGQIRGEVGLTGDKVVWRTSHDLDVELLLRPSETQVNVVAREHSEVMKGGVALVGAGLLTGIIGADVFNSELALWLSAAAGTSGFGVYWRSRVEQMRARTAKAAKGVSEVLRMVGRVNVDPE